MKTKESDLEWLEKNVSITNENTCFDYIECAKEDDKGFCVGVFVEPFGSMSFRSATKTTMKTHLERLFNAQPKEMDYITAGATLYRNRSKLFIGKQLIEDIKTEDFWNDRDLKLELKEEIELTDLEEIQEKLKKEEKIYIRLNDSIEDAYNYREALVVEVKKLESLGRNMYCLIATESSKNEETGVEGSEYIHTWFLQNEQNLLALGMEVFQEDEWEEKKKEILDFQNNYSKDLCFDEYLEKAK